MGVRQAHCCWMNWGNPGGLDGNRWLFPYDTLHSISHPKREQQVAY